VSCLCLFHFLELELDLSVASAIQTLTYSNDACQSDNVCLRPLNPVLVLSSCGKFGGLNLFYTLEWGPRAI
jgi:hypothetical protein